MFVGIEVRQIAFVQHLQGLHICLLVANAIEQIYKIGFFLSLGLPDGSYVRLTTSRYYIPSGRCIQKPYEGVEDYSRDVIKRYNSGELIHADSIHFPDSLKFYTDGKRVVYGGGGIMIEGIEMIIADIFFVS